MRKIICLLCAIMFLSINSSVTDAKFMMYGMEKAGRAYGMPIGGVYMEGELQNKGIPYKDGGYDTGVATFGDIKIPLYYHYGCDYKKGHEYYRAYGNLFGARDKSYTVALEIGEGLNCTIYNVKNNSGRAMYMLEHSGPVAGTTTYILIALTEDGKILKYIDTTNVLKDYFGRDKVSVKGPWFKNATVSGDAVRIKYEYPVYNQVTKKYDKYYGEFIYTWDENAQWFGVEHVKY